MKNTSESLEQAAVQQQCRALRLGGLGSVGLKRRRQVPGQEVVDLAHGIVGERSPLLQSLRLRT